MELSAVPLKWEWRPSKRAKSSDDEFFDQGYLFCSSSKQLLVDLDSDGQHQNHPEFSCSIAGCQHMFQTLISYEMHYNTAHRHTCSKCRRPFPSNHLLEIHLREAHDALFSVQEGSKYCCLIAGCNFTFVTTKERKNHMIKVHKYPSNYRFDRGKSWPTVSDKSRDTSNEDMEISHVNNDKENVPQKGKRIFSYKVPQSICFGQGATRSFQRPQGQGRRKKKHWHESDMETSTAVDIERVNMNELKDALTE